MTDFLRHNWKVRSKPRFLALACVLLFIGAYSLWLLNNNVAFFGKHVIHVWDLHRPPISVAVNGKYPVSAVNSQIGKIIQPTKDRIELRVTLPRGFETIDVVTHFQSSPDVQLTAGAPTARGESPNDSHYIVGTLFGDSWNILNVENGYVVTKEKISSDSAALWQVLAKAKNIIGLGPNPQNIVPIPENLVAWENIRLPFPIRSRFTVNAILGPKTQELHFTKVDTEKASKNNTLQITVMQNTNVLAKHTYSQNTPASGQQTLDLTMALPNLPIGFYTIEFIPGNESSVVQNLSFSGAEPKLSNSVFIGEYAKPLSFWALCKNTNYSVLPGKGEQTVRVNGQPTTLPNSKKTIFITSTKAASSITLDRGGVTIQSDCGFSLTAVQKVRTQMQEVYTRIRKLETFSHEDINTADVVFSNLLMAKKVDDGYEIHKTYSLRSLQAQGKTFTFYFSLPNLHDAYSKNYFYLKDVTFTAHRAPFQFSDITKLLKKVFKTD